MFDSINLVNVTKSSEKNWGPLSELIWSVNPYAANISLSTSIVLFTVVDDIMETWGHFECAFSVTKTLFHEMVLQNPHECVAILSLANTKDVREPTEIDASNITLPCSLWLCLDSAINVRPCSYLHSWYAWMILVQLFLQLVLQICRNNHSKNPK